RLEGLSEPFQQAVGRIGEILRRHGGVLMPAGMHPWFEPERETRLWPHEHGPVYRAYDRIFGCRGHGWSNLQSTHLNLPFAGDDEFGRLHAAIRLILPLLPALAASSPVVEGRVTGILDNRLDVYRTNSRRFASITGRVIPEPVYTRADYEREILEPIYRDLAPHDPQGVLLDEFANARGAIARFGRGSIEIRLLDTQETPRADLAVAAAVVGALKLLVDERWSSFEEQAMPGVDRLATLLERTTVTAERTPIVDRGYLALFGVGAGAGAGALTAGALWDRLIAEAVTTGALDEAAFGDELRVIRTGGPLARRILRALGGDTSRAHQKRIYRRLCDCLARGEMFRG
ncbi:MAG: glutamate-cysteine ligase family protein, partial [Acidobacteriota bacterium]